MLALQNRHVIEELHDAVGANDLRPTHPNAVVGATVVEPALKSNSGSASVADTAGAHGIDAGRYFICLAVKIVAGRVLARVRSKKGLIVMGVAEANLIYEGRTRRVG